MNKFELIYRIDTDLSIPRGAGDTFWIIINQETQEIVAKFRYSVHAQDYLDQLRENIIYKRIRELLKGDIEDTNDQDIKRDFGFDV